MSQPQRPQYEAASFASSSAFSTATGSESKRDVSQFVRYLLEGSGIEEDAVDFAQLRQELETIARDVDKEVGERVGDQHDNTVLIVDEPAEAGGSRIVGASNIDISSSPSGPPPTAKATPTSRQQTQQKTEDRWRPISLLPGMDEATTADYGATQYSAQLPADHSVVVQDFHQSLTDIAAQLEVLKREPERSQQSLAPATSALSSKLLTSLSQQLEQAGFQPLPVHVLTTASSDSLEEVVALARTLFWSLQTVVKEYGYKGALIEHLTSQVTSLMETAGILSENYKILEREHEVTTFAQQNRLSETNTHMAQLQDKLTKVNSHEQSLEVALHAAVDDNKRLKQRNERLERLVAETQARYDELEERVVEMEEQELRKMRRAELIAKRAISGETKRGVLARDLEDVVRMYEDRIESLHRDTHHTNAEEAAPTQPAVSPAKTNITEQEIQPDVNTSLESVDADELRIIRSIKQKGQVETSFQRLKSALLEEIGVKYGELRDELASVTAAFAEVQDEKEILKLKLMALQSGTEILAENDRKEMATKDLIRRDKEYYKLKLFKIDDMSNADCRAVIKDICVKLKIQNIDTLVSSLGDIADAIKIIPRMQKFIFAVDALIWSPPKVLDEFLRLDLDKAKANTLRPVHKLSETLHVVRQWRGAMDTEIQVLRQFRETICHLLHLPMVAGDEPHRPLDSAVLQKSVAEIKRLLNAQHDLEFRVDDRPDGASKLLQHFCELFAVAERGEIVPKMNSLYVFVADANKWLNRMQHALNSVDGKQPEQREREGKQSADTRPREALFATVLARLNSAQ